MSHQTFDLDQYLRRELRDSRARIDLLERERARLEQLLGHFLLLLTPNRAAGLLILDALADALQLNPAGRGPEPPKRRRGIPAHRMTELLRGP